MKNLFLILAMLSFSLTLSAQNDDFTEDQIENVFGDLLRDAGKYALMEMRPSASVNSARILKVKTDSRSNGGDIKARVSVSWTTAFTGRTRTHVSDVWMSVNEDNVYYTKYKMYRDDHNIEIMNRTNVTMNKLVGRFNSYSTTDDF